MKIEKTITEKHKLNCILVNKRSQIDKLREKFINVQLSIKNCKHNVMQKE